jgi:hypothetical protein
MILLFWFIFALVATVISRQGLDRRIQRLTFLLSRSTKGSLIAFAVFFFRVW